MSDLWIENTEANKPTTGRAVFFYNSHIDLVCIGSWEGKFWSWYGELNDAPIGRIDNQFVTHWAARPAAPQPANQEVGDE